MPGRVTVPASAFYCGEDIDRRIRRLLDAEAVAPISSRPIAMVAVTVVAGLAVAAQALEPLHLVFQSRNLTQLVPFVLEWGEHARVVEPVALIELVGGAARQMASYYRECKTAETAGLAAA